MNYFTRDLLQRYGSEDDEVADAANAEWEQVLDRYRHHLKQISPELPEHIRGCNELLLHDADVWSVAREGDHVLMIMRKDIPPRDLVILTYRLAAEPLINRAALPKEDCSNVMQFMYDELDLTHEGARTVYTQSILFSNGWEIQLRFHDVQVVLAEPMFPLNGTMLVPVPTSGVSQTA